MVTINNFFLGSGCQPGTVPRNLGLATLLVTDASSVDASVVPCFPGKENK